MFERVMVEFSSTEAEEVTGVSRTLQRAWRLRGILPERPGPHRVRYEIDDVLRLAALKVFSDAGLSPKASQKTAEVAASYALHLLVRLPGAVIFHKAGDPAAAEAWWLQILDTDPKPRYIIVPLPEHENAEGGPTYYARHTADDLDDAIGQHGSVCSLVFDLEALTRKVHRELSRPVISMEDPQ